MRWLVVVLSLMEIMHSAHNESSNPVPAASSWSRPTARSSTRPEWSGGRLNRDRRPPRALSGQCRVRGVMLIKLYLVNEP